MITSRWSLAVRIGEREVAAWPVGTANTEDHQNDSHQNYRADDDPG